MRRRSSKWTLVVGVGLVASAPTIAWANAGTPLIWLSMLHLLVGNLFIGILEGLVVARLFGLRRLRTCGIAILANYFSAIPGLFLSAWVGFAFDGWLAGRALWAGPYALLLVLVFAIALSALLEWPFYFFAVGTIESRARRSLRATLVAQATSHAVLVPLFLLVSTATLYTRTNIRRDLSFVRPPIADVYFVAGADVRKIRTDGTGLETVASGATPEQRLALLGSAGGSSWSLWLTGHSVSSMESSRLLLADVAATHAVSNVVRHESDASNFRVNFRQASDLRDDAHRPWSATCGAWPEEGLLIWTPNRTLDHRVSLATPFVQRSCSHPTILPAGQIVFQSNTDLLLYDPTTHTLGFLTKGTTPVAVVP